MTDPERYFETARTLMVDGQVRPNDIVDRRIIAAMRTLRRELFLPERLGSLAYVDADIRLPDGRFMLAPLTISRLLQAASLRAGDRVLVVGSGTGYGAAILARCGADVTALESDPGLRAIAKEALAAEGVEVRVIEGELVMGDPAGAPYDVIVVEGRIDFIPDAFAEQLSARGRLVAILAERGLGRIVVGEPVSGGGVAHRVVADANAGLLPGFANAPEFVF